MQKLVPALLLISVFPIGLLVAAQRTNSADQDRPIKLKTDLIELRAVVTDSAGKLVDNLTKDDFEVLENGREQQIAFFGLERVSAPTSTQWSIPRAPGPLHRQRTPTTVFFCPGREPIQRIRSCPDPRAVRFASRLPCSRATIDAYTVHREV